MTTARSPVATPATLEALEFGSYLEMLSAMAATDLGRERVRSTTWAPRLEVLDRRHRRFHEAASLLEHQRLVPSFEEPLGAVLESLSRGDSELVGIELNRLAAALRAVEGTRKAIGAADPECPELAAESERLDDLRRLVRRIESTLDRRGRVRDDASDRLMSLGGDVRRSREAIYGELRSYGKKHKDDLAEETMPLHDGRVVVLLKAGSKSRGGGLVHRGSGTGRSVYFEPLEVVEANNRMRESQQREQEERQRLLNDLVDAAREAVESIALHLDFLALLDQQQALCDFAELCEARLVEITERHSLRVSGGYHPLLDPRLASLRERALGHAGHLGEVVPLELELLPERRALVVTGPNAGGKTAALKTLGLMALAAQVGLPFPAAAGSRSPWLESVVATVGDEQDLLEDRSTFSGRLLRLREAWDAAGPDSLLLLDELGSGTDPEEGSALSIALLEGLLERGSMAMITTHLTPLAAAALEQDGATCAAMQFDASSHRPTFELLPGAPAGSEAISLGRRLGLPTEWLDRADNLLGSGHRDLRRLLAEVESIRADLEQRSHDLADRSAELENRKEETELLQASLAEERVKVGARARKDLEAFRRQVTEELREEVARIREEMEAGRKRGLAEAAVERVFEEAPEVETGQEPGPDATLGDRVEHRSLGWKGVVERVDRGKAEVNVHGKRMRCALDDLEVLEEGAGAAVSMDRAKSTPTATPTPRPDVDAVSSELNLIGHRVEEALEQLDSYLDRALLSADGEVRIIHGHGTGRLRKAIREHLRNHPAVAAVRPGRGNEGGDGATIVSLRG